MENLTCPKCQGAMRVYERNGVTVDQCSECRGIFLDRGELEKLMDAEASFNAQAVPPQAPPQQQAPPPRQPGYRDDDYRDSRDYRGGYDDKYRGQRQQYPHRKKKKSFLEELFD